MNSFISSSLLGNLDPLALLDRFPDIDSTIVDQLTKDWEKLKRKPEWIRPILNLCLVPQFQPSFVQDAHLQSAKLEDVELFGSPELGSIQLPYRMFDISSNNLVKWPTIGPMDHYAMLSHRWKGDEIVLGDILNAREKHNELASDMETQGRWSPKSDVDCVLDQAVRDVEQQVQRLAQLLKPFTSRGDVRHCLKTRLESNAAKDGFSSAQSGREKAIRELKFAHIEYLVFSNLIKEIEERTENTANLRQSVDEAEIAVQSAESKLQEATEEKRKTEKDIDFFNNNPQVSGEVDKLVQRLQKWKSAIKIKRSIERAREIFQQQKLFPGQGKCYLWLDTCCIDKKEGGELSESLALMGDWYERADFTLVQLEAKFTDFDAVHDLSQFLKLGSDAEKKPQAFKADQNKGLIETFDDIKAKKPEWAERGWTMQELVMSKTTFYVNEEWTPLSRPIERLGIFYYLIPFIKLYVDSANEADGSHASSHADFLSDIEKTLAAWDYSLWGKLWIDPPKGATEDDQRISDAQTLINVLDYLGVVFPKELDEEHAQPSIQQSIFMAQSHIDKDPHSKQAQLITVLQRRLHPEQHSSNTQTVQPEVIGALLKSLVDKTITLITEDRKKVADFGQVSELESWIEGTRRSQFSTKQVMALSSMRKITKATDHVYALMGVLGVRFPTFPAEGYVKALSRLLDEVVVVHNDVSVFNWSGMNMGSNIRGRSLYPSSHEAFLNDGGKKMSCNSILSIAVKGKVDKVLVTYHAVVSMLEDTMNLIRDGKRKDLPFHWIQSIVDITRLSSFESLEPQAQMMRRLLKYIRDDYRGPASQPDSSGSVPTSPSKGTSFLIGSACDVASSGLSAMRSVADPFAKKPSKVFGGSLSWPKKLGVTQSASAVEQSDTASLDSSQTLVNDPQQVELADERRIIDSYLQRMVAAAEENKLLTDDGPKLPQRVIVKRLHNSGSGQTIPRGDDGKRPSQLLSPNPIIVNNAGIEGIFDIQRVVVTMLDADKLRRQIALAANPRQKISGWCSISTGFAHVIVNFLCESRILEQELDVIDGVQSQVLKEQDREDGETRGLSLSRQVTGRLKVGDEKNISGGKSEKDDASAKPETKGDYDAKGDHGTTEDEKAVSRIIRFVQESELQLVAGEWVLARFSGVIGAQWFLCHLELGSTHQFYGHRIATSEIDFTHATPEPGLVKVWRVFMERKKHKMCKILNRYLKGRRRTIIKDQRIDDLGKMGARLLSGELLSNTKVGKGAASKQDVKARAHEENEDTEDEDDPAFLTGIFAHGFNAIGAIGDIAAQSAKEVFFQMKAQDMERHLNATILKKTPKALRAAVDNLSDNRDYLPSMFHSAKRVHMF